MIESGTRLGKYMIGAKIGVGGMADVYRAVDEELNREVALKVLPPEFARDEERVARFQKEVKAAAKLSHPHIVTLYDVGQAEGYHFYTMALIGGGDLKTKVQKGITTEESTRILKEIASALSHAHRHGFVHRDLKPENILFREDGTAVLTDFGIAKVVGSGTRMTKTGMSIGTPHYMSPEQARGVELDQRSDLYSLGILLYEMLTGAVPYDAPETFAVGLKHINDPLPELPPALGKFQPVLHHLLAKDPADRYSDADTLLRAVKAMESGRKLSRPGYAVKAVNSDSTSPPSGIKWAIGGGVFALALAIVVYFLVIQNQTPYTAGGGSGGSGQVPHMVNGAPSPSGSVNQFPPPSSLDKNLDSSLSTLEIQSEPVGADVFLNGRYVGSTPLKAADIGPGNHTVQLQKESYEDLFARVEVEPDAQVTRSFTLKRGTGSLTIISDPEGSTVLLDGKMLQDMTPLTIHNLGVGKHNIRVEKERYYGSEQEITVEQGKTAVLDIQLAGGNLVKIDGEWRTPEEAMKLERERQRAADELHKRQLEEKKQKADKLMKDADRLADSNSLNQVIQASKNYLAAKKLYPDLDGLDAKKRRVEKRLAEMKKREALAKQQAEEEAIKRNEKFIGVISSVRGDFGFVLIKKESPKYVKVPGNAEVDTGNRKIALNLEKEHDGLISAVPDGSMNSISIGQKVYSTY